MSREKRTHNGPEKVREPQVPTLKNPGGGKLEEEEIIVLPQTVYYRGQGVNRHHNPMGSNSQYINECNAIDLSVCYTEYIIIYTIPLCTYCD